ncbi:hypothetical protein PanWU01x14_000370, partial [Parasponia andersonii]
VIEVSSLECSRFFEHDNLEEFDIEDKRDISKL